VREERAELPGDAPGHGREAAGNDGSGGPLRAFPAPRRNR